MSSILTNSSALSALQTLKSIHSNLETVTSQVSTGKRVADAKDNPAIWAVSKVISTDISAFKTVSDNLGFGLATVGVAANAAQTIVENLGEIKNKIILAQNNNVDRTKLQADLVAYRDNITNVVKGAQFNGLNLINNGATNNILASIDRNGAVVTSTFIAVVAQNLSLGTYTAKTVFTGSDGVSTGADVAGFALNRTAGTGKLVIAEGTGANAFAAGDSVSVAIAGRTASYTVTAADVAATNTNEVVAIGLKLATEALGITGLAVNFDTVGGTANLNFTNTGGVDYRVAAQFSNVGAGGLGVLTAMNIGTQGGATAALNSIESQISAAITAAANLSTVQVKLSTQQAFVNSLADTMKLGIGALVDTDMEEASARLQALQVQQQLSTQALSIANQQPQSLLSLFR